MAIEKPYGLGIQSVQLPAEVLATSATNLFIGPTRPGVDGISARGRTTDLLLDFDDVTRRVTNVIVNARGFGFTSAPTVQFEKGEVNGTWWSCTPTMVDFDDASFVHGGLTKRGAGTLTLTRANTYGGATRLEGGTLADGLPGGAVEFPAAALMAANGTTPLLTAVRYTGGALRVTEANTLDVETWRGMKKVATFDQPLASLPSVAFVNADGTAADSGAWIFNLTDGGKSITFGYARGTVLILR